MNRRFQTTRWSLVQAARSNGDTEAREALATLCETYWYPLWAYVRRRGHGIEEATDLTQGYFTLLLEKDYLGDARPSAGRLRTFLLTSLKHYLANEWDRTKAQKRGGGVAPLSLDAGEAEGRYRLELADRLTPEKVFERRWALTVVERSLAQLGEESERGGKAERFQAMRPFLITGGPQRPYRELAEELGMSEGAVKVAVHRLRRRLGELLRAEIAETVASEAEADAELRYLLGVLGDAP